MLAVKVISSDNCRSCCDDVKYFCCFKNDHLVVWLTCSNWDYQEATDLQDSDVIVVIAIVGMVDHSLGGDPFAQIHKDDVAQDDNDGDDADEGDGGDDGYDDVADRPHW